MRKRKRKASRMTARFLAWVTSGQSGGGGAQETAVWAAGRHRANNCGDLAFRKACGRAFSWEGITPRIGTPHLEINTVGGTSKGDHREPRTGGTEFVFQKKTFSLVAPTVGYRSLCVFGH